MLWIWFIWIQKKTAWVRQDCSSGRVAQLCGRSHCWNAKITCIRTHRCAVWCFLTGSVGGSCTCLVLLSYSLRGSCRSPSSWSRPEQWPTLSSKPGSTVIAFLRHLTPRCHYKLLFLFSVSLTGKDPSGFIKRWQIHHINLKCIHITELHYNTEAVNCLVFYFCLY